MNSARIKAYAALAIASLIWGAAQPLIKPALGFVYPLQFMWLRYLIALPIGIGALTYTLRTYRPGLKTILMVSGIEVVALINLVILYSGLQHTSALQSSLILNTRPIFITLMGILLLREREERHEWLGLLLSVIGIVLVVLSPYLNHTPLSEISYRGNLLVVLTNVIYMATTYFSKKTYKQIPKVFVTALNTMNGFFLFLFLNVALYGQLPLAHLGQTAVLMPVLYMGLLGTLLANSLSIYGYLKIEASEATLFSYLEPLVYIPLAIFWLKEPINLVQIVSLAAVVGGVVMAAARFSYRPRRSSLFHGLPIFVSRRKAEESLPVHHHFQR